MKWHAQVVHVVRKDLNLLRPLLLAYAAVVAGATATAAGWRPLGSESTLIWMLTVVVLGGLLLARLIQEDPPSGSTAYWVTLPLSRSAVFAAKVAGAVLFLLVLPLLGQLAALFAHAVGAGALLPLLADSALAYGVWLGCAAVLAALTRDLRTFFVAFLLVTFGGLFTLHVIGFLLRVPREAEPSGGMLVPAMAVGGTLLVLAHQYRTRDVRRGTWLAAGLGMAVLLLPVAMLHPGRSVAAAGGAPPDGARAAALRVHEVRFGPMGHTQLHLVIDGYSEFHQYLLLNPAAHLRMPDGSTEAVEMDSPYIPLNNPAPRLAEGLRWLGDWPSAHAPTVTVAVELSRHQREALAAGGARLVVEGHFQVREARVQAELPLVPGAAVAADGRRTRVVRVDPGSDGPSVEVEVSAVARPQSRRDEFLEWTHHGGAVRYVVVNRGRGEALHMVLGSGSGSGFALVLPGPQAQTQRSGLRPDRSFSDLELARDWHLGAHLLFVAWVPREGGPVVLEAGG